MKWTFVLLMAIIRGSIIAQAEYQHIRVSDDIELIKLSDHAFVHVSWFETTSYGRVSSNGLIYIQNSNAFLFDTPMSEPLTKDLVKWITDSMHLKISGFVANHWHEDCMGGLFYLQSLNIPTYANKRTIAIAQSKQLAVPANGFDQKLRIIFGSRTIECYYPGSAHTTDNIVIWLKDEKILFAGCMAKTIDAKTLGNTADGNLNTYPSTIRKVIRRYPEAKIVIPGHGSFGGTELLRHTLELTKKKQS